MIYLNIVSIIYITICLLYYLYWEGVFFMKKASKLLLICIILTFITLLTGCKKGATMDTRKDINNNQETNKTTKQDDNLRNDISVSPTPTFDQLQVDSSDYNYTLHISNSNPVKISDNLYGLFFEDINFAVDGGIYAEMIKNRSFEYGKMATGGNKHGWNTLGDISFDIIDGSSDGTFLNQHNPNYARLTNSSGSLAGIGNMGFLDGLSITENAVYDFSAYFRSKDYSGPIVVRLQDRDGNIHGETSISGIKDQWWKYEAEITASSTIAQGLKLYVLIEDGCVDMDMISLFPRDTYKNRKNGLRKDIAQTLEALSPAFIRFPGGCVVEGKTLDSAYDWKSSIGNGLEFEINGEVTYGDVATRPLGVNIWGNLNAASNHPYYMSYGLGFYEYFLLCEDLGAEPIPIVNAGLSCQIQGVKSTGTPAQLHAIGTEEFNQYIQDALDLVEFCRGGADSKWGAVRISLGHEEPFTLNYIGIGNEQWGEVYFSRYEAFKEAFQKAAEENPEMYGGIELIVANGPVASDRYAWNKIRLHGSDYAGLVDEHYYMMPSWFLSNTHRYDSYDRNSTPVFLGEYAAKSNTAQAALAEAAFMTGLERNGDIVQLASYAPLFGNSTAVQWTPDLIWFNNNSVWGSVNYYVQKIFANNKSDYVLSTTLEGRKESSGSTISGKIGLGTWMTAATFDNIKVVDNDTGEILFSDDFETNTLDTYTQIGGKWTIDDGKLKQSQASHPVNSVTGDVIYIGNENWSNYTLTLSAIKFGGNEGFLIPFAVKDKDNFFHFNIGGWDNTVACLEQTIGGSKSGQIPETVTNFSVKNNTVYEIKIVVTDNNIKCFINDRQLVNYNIPQPEALYQVTGLDEKGDLIIKLVNVSDTAQNILIKSEDIKIEKGTASLSLLAAETLGDLNNENNPEKVTIKDSTIEVDEAFIYTAPKYSVSVLRIPVQ